MTGNALYINGCAVPITGDVRHITRRGMYPGELRFTVIGEVFAGDDISFFNGGGEVFCGKVFTVIRRGGVCECLSYDLLRYFRNKDTFAYENLTAGELLRIICSAYGLPTGDIADTKMRISSRLDDGRSLFSIMESALTMTRSAGYGEYILYDCGGAITLLGAEALDSGIVITPEECREFIISESIDENFYSSVKLSEATDGGRRYHVFKDADALCKYGQIGYFGSLSAVENGSVVGKSILSAYSLPSVTLDCHVMFCNDELRGGAAVTSVIDGRMKRMICDRVERIYSAETDEMKLKLSSI